MGSMRSLKSTAGVVANSVLDKAEGMRCSMFNSFAHVSSVHCILACRNVVRK